MRNNFSTTSKTAILLFAQSEDRESVSKPIAFQKSKNVLIWKKMNERVEKVIQKTNHPYFISNETTQIGNTFGEKITHAIQSVFEKGFEKVIVVGNDCLLLQKSHLLEALEKLERSDFVFGANNRGGTYLMGVSKTNFNAKAFEKINWQTKTVFDELILLYKNKSIYYLPCLQDCNTEYDFESVLKLLPFNAWFKHLLTSLLKFYNFCFTNQDTTICLEHLEINYNKGPPIKLLF
jgi:uncharacterized protein